METITKHSDTEIAITPEPVIVKLSDIVAEVESLSKDKGQKEAVLEQTKRMNRSAEDNAQAEIDALAEKIAVLQNRITKAEELKVEVSVESVTLNA